MRNVRRCIAKDREKNKLSYGGVLLNNMKDFYFGDVNKDGEAHGVGRSSNLEDSSI